MFKKRKENMQKVYEKLWKKGRSKESSRQKLDNFFKWIKRKS